jgi:hypothetical protein
LFPANILYLELHSVCFIVCNNKVTSPPFVCVVQQHRMDGLEKNGYKKDASSEEEFPAKIFRCIKVTISPSNLVRNKIFHACCFFFPELSWMAYYPTLALMSCIFGIH